MNFPISFDLIGIFRSPTKISKAREQIEIVVCGWLYCWEIYVFCLLKYNNSKERMSRQFSQLHCLPRFTIQTQAHTNERCSINLGATSHIICRGKLNSKFVCAWTRLENKVVRQFLTWKQVFQVMCSQCILSDSDVKVVLAFMELIRKKNS